MSKFNVTQSDCGPLECYDRQNQSDLSEEETFKIFARHVDFWGVVVDITERSVVLNCFNFKRERGRTVELVVEADNEHLQLFYLMAAFMLKFLEGKGTPTAEEHRPRLLAEALRHLAIQPDWSYLHNQDLQTCHVARALMIFLIVERARLTTTQDQLSYCNWLAGRLTQLRFADLQTAAEMILFNKDVVVHDIVDAVLPL